MSWRRISLASGTGSAISAVKPLPCLPTSHAVQGLCALSSPHGLFHEVSKAYTLSPLDRKPPIQNQFRTFSKMVDPRSWWSGSRSPTSPLGSSASADFESKPMDIPEETSTEVETLPTRRVHILGIGSIGTLIAHSLRCLPNPPPLSLLLHKTEMYNEFRFGGRTIRLINKQTDTNDEQRGYDVDLLETNEDTGLPFWRYIPDRPSREQPVTNSLTEHEATDTGETYIYTLIVTVKAPATVRALESIKHRVNSDTTICFIQNGMGQIEEINRLVFPDPAKRPTYMLGIISHGAHMERNFNVVHAGFGSTSLGIWRDPEKFPFPPKSSTTLDIQNLSDEDRKRMYPGDKDLYANLSSRYLLRTLTRSPVLACAAFPYVDLFQLQLEKLAVNAILNPLTGLLNVPNGSLLNDEYLTRVQRLLLAEISLVFRSLPELEGIPGVQLRFSPTRLENLVLSVTQKTALNSSSMREDVRNLRHTEIQYINAHIVRRGEELGIKCVLNYMITQLLEAKSYMTREENHRQVYDMSDIVATNAPSSSSFTTSNPSTLTREEADAEPGVVILEDQGTQITGRPY